MRPTPIITTLSITISIDCGKKKEDSIPQPNDSIATPITFNTDLDLFI